MRPTARAARAVAGCLVVAALGRGAAAEVVPVDVPAGFAAEIYAGGLGAPRGLAVDPGGTLLVSVSSRGQIVALRDRGGGRAPEPVVVADELHLPHGLAFRDGHLYVAETGRVVRFQYDPVALAARHPVPIVTGLPSPTHHWTRGIAFGPDGRMYVSIGSSCDVCREADRRRAAIVRYDPSGGGERLVATGLRNPVGLAFHPATGVLWTTVNERDWRRGGAPPDYITEVRPGTAYGWPDCYAEGARFASDPQLPDPAPCRGLTLPTLEIPPHSAPLGLAFYTGSAFPPAYRDSLYVALHGSRPELPAAGYKVVRVRFEGGRAVGVEDFATGWRGQGRVWGRPVDVVTGRDGALYVSDDFGGRVLRIAYRPR